MTRVYLVGAGPGDPGLLTLRGREALGRADVILFDHLANPRLLEGVRPGAETLFVGKQGFSEYVSQEEINRLIVERARAGQVVVRLKGGDPFVFGRGGEEALACLEAGVGFEVVPGVSSAVAVPAYAGVPVTHRGLARSFAVLTGNEAGGEAELDYAGLRGVDTLVFLMGVRALPRLAAGLLEAGRAPATPAATIEWGTTPRQRTVVATLATLPEAVSEAGLGAPAVTVVGEVAGLREELAWFERRPLHGRRVVATRTREGNSRLRPLLEAAGAEVLEVPLLRHAEPEDASALKAAVDDVGIYDWIAFTSQEGVRALLGQLFADDRDARALAGLRLAAVGPATARELEGYGLRADFVGSRFGAEALAAELPLTGGERVLHPASEIAGPELENGLEGRGARVNRVTAYRTLPAEVPPALLEEARAADAVTFGSASAVRAYAALAGTDGLAACIGPATAEAAGEAGFSRVVVAEEATLEALVAVLGACFVGDASDGG